MRTLVQLVGLLLANEIAGGKIPKPLALPLGYLVSRLRTPPMTFAVLSCVLQQLAPDRSRRGHRKPSRS